MKTLIIIFSLIFNISNIDDEIVVENPIVIEKLDYEMSVDDQVRIPNKSSSDITLNYQSNDTSVVTVDQNGLITALAAGNTSIKVSTNYEDKDFEVILNVRVKGVEKAITFAQDSFYLIRGLTYELEYTLTNINSSDISWSSSNPNVASVINGVVTGKAIGDTTVTASFGDISASMTISVTVPLKNITFNPATLSMIVGDERGIPSLIYVPFDTTSSRSASYYSSDESIATISDGLIKAVSVGETRIIANVSGVETSLTITVLPKKSESGSDILDYAVKEVSDDKLMLTYQGDNDFKANKFLVNLPLDAIISYMDSVENPHITLSLRKEMVNGNMAKVESIYLPLEVMEAIGETGLKVDLLDQNGDLLMRYFFKQASTHPFDLKYSLASVNENSSLYSKIGGKSFRLRINNDMGMDINLIFPASATGSLPTQYHFIYEYKSEVLNDTNQSVLVGKDKQFNFDVNASDYVITFSRISASNNSNVILYLGIIVGLIGLASGAYYFIKVKKPKKL